MSRFKGEDEPKEDMIAIAGAKGGSGKTTTTLGLGRAFARTGTPVLAIDADRQLPNLHVKGGVDRSPTIADASTADSVEAVVQRAPTPEEIGILPAPTDDQSIEMQPALDELETDIAHMLVDCPSGTGPDLIEPLSVSDGVVVVSTETEQSIESAAMTVDIARRIGVDVYGVVFTKTTAVPDDGRDRFDVPILGTVPERDNPLTDDTAMNAYEAIVEELAEIIELPGQDQATESTTEGGHDPPADPDPTPDNAAGDVPDVSAETNGTPSSEQTAMADGPQSAAGMTGSSTPTVRPPDDRSRRTTGVGALDEALSGGIPRGSLVALVADPKSRAELLLHRLTDTRGTLYLSTRRSGDIVRSDLDCSAVPAGTPTIRAVGGDNAIGDATELISDLPERANLIVDPVNTFERRERGRYTEFLNDLREHVTATDDVAVVHCLTEPSTPANRSTTEHFADIVLEARRPEQTDCDLLIDVPKFRTGEHIDSTVQLSFDRFEE